MPLSQVRAGMNCTAYTVIQGTTISSFDVQVLGIVNQTAGQGARIFVSVSGPAVAASGIAEGFSGSPVYCPAQDGTMENIGAISEGVGQYGNNVGLVTPIQQMLGEPVDPPSSAPHTDFKTTPLLGPLTFGGLSPSLMGLVEKAGRRAGRLVVAAPDGYMPSFPVQQLVPGASVAASYSNGVIAAGAIGTVTYRDGNDVYVFGHELDGAGRRSLYLQDAYVFGVIDNPDPALAPSYKLASPGHTLGTITSDTPNAVIGTVGAPPGQIPVDVTAHDLDTGQTIAEDTDVADETASVSARQLAARTSSRRSRWSGGDRRSTTGHPPASRARCAWRSTCARAAALDFCDRYVGTGAPETRGGPPEVSNAASTDVSTAFSDFERVDFAALHVTHVVADMTPRVGWRRVDLSARAVGPVKAGRTARVRLLVRVYRGPLRRVSFRIRVPRGASGLLPVTIKGPATPTPATANGLSSQLVVSLSASSSSSGSGTEPRRSPRSMSCATRSGRSRPTTGCTRTCPGAASVSVFRDPSLLITGRTTLLLSVKP